MSSDHDRELKPFVYKNANMQVRPVWPRKEHACQRLDVFHLHAALAQGHGCHAHDDCWVIEPWFGGL